MLCIFLPTDTLSLLFNIIVLNIFKVTCVPIFRSMYIHKNVCRHMVLFQNDRVLGNKELYYKIKHMSFMHYMCWKIIMKKSNSQPKLSSFFNIASSKAVG